MICGYQLHLDSLRSLNFVDSWSTGHVCDCFICWHEQTRIGCWKTIFVDWPPNFFSRASFWLEELRATWGLTVSKIQPHSQPDLWKTTWFIVNYLRDDNWGICLPNNMEIMGECGCQRSLCWHCDHVCHLVDSTIRWIDRWCYSVCISLSFAHCFPGPPDWVKIFSIAEPCRRPLYPQRSVSPSLWPEMMRITQLLCIVFQ